MDKTKLAYLAGIIDGEGTINITYLKARNEYRLRISVVNTNVRLIDWLSSNFGGLAYQAKRHQVKNPTWKDKWEWIYIPSRDRLDLLNALLPFMVIKDEQLKVALKYLATTSTSGIRLTNEAKNIRKSCFEQLRMLNSGVAAETE